MSTKIRLAAALTLIVSMFTATMSASAFHEGGDEYHPIEEDEFEEVWERTDRPVAETEVARTWIWGPGAFSDLMTEDYDDAEGGEREVQYFDKSRMEMPRNGEADEDSPWFITQGRLAYELMTGNLQLGDEEEDFEQHHPSHRSASGDPDDATAPTYEAMGNLMGEEARDTGDLITEFADHEGSVSEDEDLADFGVTDAEYDDVTDHNIASVFWAFMTSESTVYEDGDYVEDDLFENPYYAVGRPLTEAYWAWSEVDNEEQYVLIQCFERRCLTYTPDNPEGWEVESGNIGQHYYNWRYHEIDREGPTAGSFTFDGEESARIDIDEEIDLTAHVTAQGEDAEDAPVYFHVIGGDEDAVSLEPDRARTGADGTAEVTVTGESDGMAEVQAFVDLTGNGEYDFEEDLGLGVVEVTVGEDENGDGEAVAASGTFATTEGDDSTQLDVDENVTLMAHVEDAEGDPVEDAPVYFHVIDGDENAVSLDPERARTDVDGNAQVTVTGEAAGIAEVHAFVDMNDNGTYDLETDIGLMDLVEVDVTDGNE